MVSKYTNQLNYNKNLTIELEQLESFVINKTNEAMKMETTVVAPNEGAINKVQLKGGTLVNTINLILVLYCWLLFKFKSIFQSTYQNTNCNRLTCS